MSAKGLSCRLFVTDLDGTVLVEDGANGVRTPARTVAALRALQDKGVTVCLASGRMHESIVHIAEAMGLHGPVISYNGAMTTLEDGRVLDHRPLPASIAAEVVEHAERESIALNFYFEGNIYSKRFAPWWDRYEGRTSSPMREVQSLLPYAAQAPTKLLMMSEAATIKRLEGHFKPRFEGLANVLITADEYLEFMDLSAHKGSALQRLAAELGVEKADIVAAGDGYNDIEMLQAAGTGLAVENARQALKDVATHIVPGPEKSGVAEFIETQLL